MAKQIEDQPKEIEVIHIWIVASTFENMVRGDMLGRDQYQIIEVLPNGEEYPDDEVWCKLKSEAGKAYGKLKKYTFEKRK